MSHFEQHADFYNSAIRLSEEEKADPIEVFQSFFCAWKLAEARKTLWDMVESALAANCSVFDDADARFNLLWFYKRMESVLEAGQLLCQQPPKRQRKDRRRESKKSGKTNQKLRKSAIAM